jgi:hypothetical protein
MLIMISLVSIKDDKTLPESAKCRKIRVPKFT